MRPIHITDHATARIQMRGARPQDVFVLSQCADREVHLGDGAAVVSLSRAAGDKLRAAGLACAFVDRLEKLALVVAEDTGAIVTILKGRILDPTYRANGRHKHRRGGPRGGRP